nr:hypothetical protein [Rickettsiaceae bacterium]
MKIFSNEINKLITFISTGQIKAMLLYGPNQGLKEAIVQKVINHNNFIVSNNNGKDLLPDSFLMSVNSTNLFATREIVKFNNISNIISKDISKLLTEQDFVNFICFIAEDSLPKTGIRKLFEDHTQLVAIGCYFEENISKLIIQLSHQRNYSISKDALLYLSSNLQGDHLLIKGEIEKIFSYVGNKKYIELEDIKSVLSIDLNSNSDQMCIYFARKEYNHFEKELSKLKQHGINDILIIRSLIRYFINIYYMNAYIEQGIDYDLAIKKLPNAIFYKYLADFKQIITQYNSIEAIKMLSQLHEAEMKYKQNPNDFYLFLIACQN